MNWRRAPELPPEYRLVLVQVAEHGGRAAAVAVGYVKNFSNGPCWITPGVGGPDVVAWADCLGDDFTADVWPGTAAGGPLSNACNRERCAACEESGCGVCLECAKRQRGLTTPPRVFYFGCIRRPGHYWWRAEGADGKDFKGIPSPPASPRPWELKELPREHEVDGKLAPIGSFDQVEGVANLVDLLPGWTLLAFWDRSVDGRQGSNSVFAVEGKHDFDATVAAARAAFPSVWARFKFEVKKR